MSHRMGGQKTSLPHEEANRAFRKIEMISFDHKEERPLYSHVELRKYQKPEPDFYSVMTNLSVPSIKEAEDIAIQWTNIFSTFYQDTHYDIITTERRNDVASQKTTGFHQRKKNKN